jgi:hypothetical protein
VGVEPTDDRIACHPPVLKTGTITGPHALPQTDWAKADTLAPMILSQGGAFQQISLWDLAATGSLGPGWQSTGLPENPWGMVQWKIRSLLHFPGFPYSIDVISGRGC